MTDARPRSVPVATVRDHLAPFVDAGWSYLVIADAAGVSHGTVVNVMRGRRPTVKAGTATELLALDWADLVAHQHAAQKVPAVGTRRRIEALVWAGWTIDTIAERAGVNRASLQRALYGHRTHVTSRTAQAVHTAFRAMWDQEPPTPDWKAARAVKQARNRARLRGYQPGAAWDAIDDPQATPDTGRADGRDGVSAEDIAWVVRFERHTWATLADRFGISPHGLKQALHRAGRGDLIASITEQTRAVA